MNSIVELFRKFSQKMSDIVGSTWAFIAATFLILVWLITGPIFHFSDTWQLVVNTLTSVVTFLMVFLIQNAQNRDSKATHLKLDELIRSTKARNTMIDAEDLSESELDEHKEHMKKQKVKKR